MHKVWIKIKQGSRTEYSKFINLLEWNYYIDINTLNCKKVEDNFSKDFHKLMNNPVFGKTMEKLRGRFDLCLSLRCKVLGQNFNFKIKRDSGKNFLWSLRLWVGRW